MTRIICLEEQHAAGRLPLRRIDNWPTKASAPVAKDFAQPRSDGVSKRKMRAIAVRHPRVQVHRLQDGTVHRASRPRLGDARAKL